MKDPRLFVPIDVGMPTHSKLAGLDGRAKWLAITGLCWAKQDLKDGIFFPQIVVAIADVPTKFVKTLIDRDVWHGKGHACPRCPQPALDGQVVIHDFLGHNRSAEAVSSIRTARIAAGKAANHKRWKHDGPVEECARCND